MTDARLATYREALLSWNRRINLIGPDARDHLNEHIEESLAAAAILEPSGEVLDFGSGGGLPAIPMAIASPDARFHLVESDQKKWAFLKHVVRECELNAQVHGDRLARVVEGWNRELRLNLVTSRAVGGATEWVPAVQPLLLPGARIALFQSSPVAPSIAGFAPAGSFPLPRGKSNYLVVLMFHVEQ